ncbi:MAG: DUF547 domain-containing protein [Ferruginibacter sp.]|nr:DUF547 domain-containing protein [Ferruginibacter sp.]
MKKYTFLSFSVFLLFISTHAQVKNLPDYFNKTDKFLSANVKAGKVNYKSINADKSMLDELVSFAGGKQKFSSSTEEKAYYLNTYNIMVIKGIINNYPTKGPMETSGFFDKKTFTVNGVSVTLNGIENDIVRKKYNDARIHFALVCGAKSCPPIQPYAFRPEKLDAQLETLAKQSIQSKSFTKVDNKNGKASVSMIFNWYKDDFIKAKGSVVNFLNA